MPDDDSLQVVCCPPEQSAEAASLVLCELAADQRREIAPALFDGESSGHSDDLLYVALRSGDVCGATWGQRQPGHTAVLWPPQLARGADATTAVRLARAVVAALDDAEVDMAQVLLRGRDAEREAVLMAAGFQYLTDLSYLSCEASCFPTELPRRGGLEFEVYDDSQRARLADVLNRTYVGTRDCPRLNGVRRMDDVIAGYRATGTFDARNWLFVRAEGEAQDVGALLLAVYPQLRHWELVYMGVAPEARGHGWGVEITRHALGLARRAEAERVVLAVDVANEPALAMYRQAGFVAWDRRSVFVRFRGAT